MGFERFKALRGGVEMLVTMRDDFGLGCGEHLFRWNAIDPSLVRKFLVVGKIQAHK